jgi:glycosyltransferase involved in cell wall biosynthesis
MGARGKQVTGMKINWFSPLPPATTGIANYTQGILPALTTQADVTLWTDRTGWDPTLEKYAWIRHYDPDRMDWVELNRADLSFYNLGNNHLFHAAIWQVSRRAAGIVVLHDFRLHDFFECLYRVQWRDADAYLAQMERQYGEEGLRAATEFVNARKGDYDLMAQRFPLTPLALENSLGTVVHTREAFEELKTAKRFAVVYAPLPAATLVSQRSLSVNRASNPYGLIIFGHIGRNRRLDAVLKALSELPNRDRFRLDIYGKIDDEKTLRQRVQTLRLEDIVTAHGYAPAAKLEQALSAASLAINLRYPTMGEASASQLEIWSHALPTLVTKVGWYASLSEETVAHVRPEHEVEDIRHYLKSFLADPDRFARMGERGLSLLQQQHHPDAYVATILSLVSNARQLRLRKAAYDMARRAGALMREWAPDSDDASRSVAEKIHAMTAEPGSL